MRLPHSLVLCVLLTPVLAMGAPPPTHTVTNTNDSGAGSFRQAIADSAAGDLVEFDPLLVNSTITVASELLIDKLLNINVIAKVPITVSGGHTTRVLHIASTGYVLINNMTFRDGYAAGGGGISNQGTLELHTSTITENRSPSAGGGGIHNSGTLKVFNSTISYNVAASGYGGGIDNVFGGHVTMSNSTVSGNVAGLGGGIDNYSTGSTVVAKFCTIAYNRASVTGGGIHAAEGDASTVELEATILYGNGAGTASPDCSGTLKSSDYDLIGSLSACTLSGTTTHNRSGDPVLGSLQANGGPTHTHPLRAGSDAMDKIPSGSCADAMSADQRGLARGLDGTATGSTSCDIGAYEAAKPIVVNSLLDPSEASKCTLRDAILAANTNAVVNGCAAGTTGVDRIVIPIGGRIRLTAGALNPTRSVLIEGPGLPLTVSGERLSSVFVIGDTTGFQTFGISGMTIANGAASYGGGVQMYQEISTLAIDRVSFEDNVVAGGIGGSINVQNSGYTEIEASSFSNTRALSHTASVATIGSPVTIRRSTIGETHSETAAVYDISINVLASLRLIGCTISGSEPDGVYVSTNASLEVQGSVFAGHGQEFHDLGGTLVSRGYNVIADGTGPVSATGDVKNAVTNLAPHLFGGGDTKTIAPLPGSAAIDLIPLTDCPGTLDQRGVARPLDGDRNGTARCDAGAFETPPPIVVNSLLDPSDAGKCTLHDAINASVTKSAAGGCAAGTAGAQDLITFSVNGTIQLSSGLVPTASVAIRGPGASRLTISGQGTKRIFDPGLTGNIIHGDYTFTGLTIANGHADFGGGIQAVLQNTIALSGVTMKDNIATSTGGALYVQGTNAVQLERSTFTNPSGSSAGSLVEVTNASAEAESCTIADSSGVTALEIRAAQPGGTAYLRTKNLTVSETNGSGIVANAVSGALPADARAEYSGTIVQASTFAWVVGGGTGVTLGYNLGSDYTIGGGPGDLQNTDAMLLPLGYHGGETPVFNLKPGSPAKDAIPTSACGPAADQRGFARPFGTACDMGAVERRPGGDVNGDGHFDVADVFYLINFLFVGGPVPLGEPDMNGDGVVDVTDVFYAINSLFAGGPAPV